MGSLLVTLIRNNGIAVVLSSCLLLSALYCAWLRSEVRALDEKLLLCNTKNASLALSNQSLLASIRQQNSAIHRLAMETEARKKRTAEATQAAKVQSNAYKSKALAIMEKEIAGDECIQIKQLLEDYAVMLKKQ